MGGDDCYIDTVVSILILSMVWSIVEVCFSTLSQEVGAVSLILKNQLEGDKENKNLICVIL